MGKMCKKCQKGRKSKKGKVSGVDMEQAFDFDFMEIGEMAIGAVGVNLVANPIINAIWDKSKGKTRPTWATLAVKGGIALALNSVDNRTAKNAAKGVVINIVAELINKYAPDAMKDKLKSEDAVEGYGDEDIEYIDLAEELAGVDSMLNEVAGAEREEVFAGGW